MNNVNPLSFNDFTDWVVEQQQLALRQMKTTTGEEFSDHIAKFELFGNTLTVIYEFKKQRGANHGA